MASEIVLDVDPWQHEIIQSPAREKICMGGRGVGKTVGLLRNLFVLKGLSTIDEEWAYFGPTYSIAMRERRIIAKNRLLAPYIEQSSDQPFPYIKWRSGTSTYFRSMDREENLLGYHLNGAAIDEIHKIGERALDEIVRPQIGAKRGDLLLIGQHDEDGEEGWINKRFFMPGQDQTQDRTRSWRIPSSMGRMYQGPEGRAELDAIKASTPDLIWRWQYMAEAVETGNRAFRPEDLRACTTGQNEDRAQMGAAYALGYDLGKVVDPSGHVVLRALTKESARVVNSGLRPLMERHEQQALVLQRLVRVFGDCPALIDTTGGAGGGHAGSEQEPYVKYYRDVIPSMRAFSLTVKNKMAIVQSLQLAIEQRKLEIPAANEELHKQLLRYRWERRHGSIQYEGPNGHDDDLVIALAMAWYAFERGWCGSNNTRNLGGVF